MKNFLCNYLVVVGIAIISLVLVNSQGNVTDLSLTNIEALDQDSGDIRLYCDGSTDTVCSHGGHYMVGLLRVSYD